MNNKDERAFVSQRNREIADFLVGGSSDPGDAAAYFGISTSELKDGAFLGGVKQCECCKFWHYEDELNRLDGQDVCYDCASNGEVMGRDD